VVGAYWTHESILLENQGHPVTILRMEEWGVPDYYELVLVTNESLLKSKPGVIARFVRAVRKGYEDAARNPQAGVDILLKGTKAEVDEKIERPGATLLAPLWQTATIPFGTQEAARWEGFTRWMQANGLLGNQVQAADAYTNRFSGGN
jgi:putative hydroxymethylpyrimidine transport system substrate-binding protein